MRELKRETGHGCETSGEGLLEHQKKSAKPGECKYIPTSRFYCPSLILWKITSMLPYSYDGRQYWKQTW